MRTRERHCSTRGARSHARRVLVPSPASGSVPTRGGLACLSRFKFKRVLGRPSAGSAVLSWATRRSEARFCTYNSGREGSLPARRVHSARHIASRRVPRRLGAYGRAHPQTHPPSTLFRSQYALPRAVLTLTSPPTNRVSVRACAFPPHAPCLVLIPACPREARAPRMCHGWVVR